MKNRLTIIIILLSFTQIKAQEKIDYLNEGLESIENRMTWFSDAKYGMFIHFGLYSQLGGVWKDKPTDGYAEWIQATQDIASQEYAMLTHTFNPENFNADFIAETAKKAGMKYIVITTKHHEGFCLWLFERAKHQYEP